VAALSVERRSEFAPTTKGTRIALSFCVTGPELLGGFYDQIIEVCEETNMKQTALILFVMILLAASLRAQENDQVRIGTNLVSVNVSVNNRSGSYVGGLSREQFQLFDNDVQQRIAFFSAEDSPSIIGIVYDMHPSTSEHTRARLESLKLFVKTLRAEDRFFIVAFNEDGSLVLDFIPNQEQVETHLARGTGKGPNSLYDAVFLAAGKIRESQLPKRALLVISDGTDHNSERGYKDLSDRLREFDVQVYAIMLPPLITGGPIAGNDYRWEFEDLSSPNGRRPLLADSDIVFGRAVFDELARITGGTAFFPEARTDRELLGICTQIGLELRRQYTLGFYPTDSAEGTVRHRLSIKFQPANRSQVGYVLSHRTTYQLIQEAQVPLQQD
jgi:VWFA-related protein